MNKKAKQTIITSIIISLIAIIFLTSYFVLAQEQIGVTRNLSSSANPNEIISVTLNVGLTSSTTTYAIEEYIPSGWTIIDDGGGGTSNKSVLKWVSFNAENTTYTYTVQAPSQTGNYNFSGIYLFEGGVLKDIMGDTEIEVLEDWIIEGDKVYFNDSFVYLSADPHTISSPGWVYFNLTSKQYEGEIDAVWGFDSPNVKPTKAELFKPHWVNWTKNSSKFFLNVSDFSVTSASCNYGNEYNNLKRNATYQICGERNESEMEKCLYYNTTSSIVCFDSYEQDGNNYTTFWETKYSRLDDWVDFTGSFNKVNKDFQGMNTWYYIKNVNITEDKPYKIRAYVDMPIGLTKTEGKYFWAIKRSSDTIQEAIDSGYFYYLDPWYNSNWLKRKNITIDHNKVNGTQTNFPMLINITDTDLRDDAQADGDDIVFANSSGSKLDHEIEFYNGTTGWLVAWVRIPTLEDTTNTVIQMYYNNSGASNQENVNGVWDDNFKMVQHMDDYNTSYIDDSTSYGNNGTKYAVNEPIENSSGQMDGSQTFDGVDDYVDLGNDVSLDITTKYTLSAWINPNTYGKHTNGLGRIISKRDTEGADSIDFLINKDFSEGGTNNLLIVADGNPRFSNSNVISLDIWQYVAVTWDGGTLIFYVDGIAQGTDTNNNNLTANAQDLYIGKWGGGTTLNFNGSIDEVRISHISRSAGWINTSYQNQNSPSSFYGVGSEESANNAPTTPILNAPANNTYFLDHPTLDIPLNWSNSSDSDGDPITYYLEIWNETAMTNSMYVNTSITETTNTTGDIVTFPNVSSDDFFWRVLATDGTDNSSWTDLWNVSIGYTGVADTCTYSGSGTWNVDCADYCNITSNVNLLGNDIHITGTGKFKTTARITNWTNRYIAGTDSNNRCHVYSLAGGGFGP